MDIPHFVIRLVEVTPLFFPLSETPCYRIKCFSHNISFSLEIIFLFDINNNSLRWKIIFTTKQYIVQGIWSVLESVILSIGIWFWLTTSIFFYLRIQICAKEFNVIILQIHCVLTICDLDFVTKQKWCLIHISMAWSKTAVTPLLTHWSYCCFA